MSFGKVVAEVAKDSVKLLTKKSPLLLTLFGMGLSVGATVEGIRSTPEAYERYKAIMKKDIPDSEKRKEILVDVVPLYIPTLILTSTSIAAVVSGYKINSKRLAEMTTAYLLMANSAKEYKDAVISKIGGEANEEIENDIAKKRMEEIKAVKNGTKIMDDEDFDLKYNKKLRFKDTMSGQRYITTVNDIVTACLDLVERLSDEDEISLSDFYYAIDAVGADPNADSVEKSGWLVGDASLLCPKISELPECDPFDGKQYYILRMDTNPRYADYIATKRR